MPFGLVGFFPIRPCRAARCNGATGISRNQSRAPPAETGQRPGRPSSEAEQCTHTQENISVILQLLVVAIRMSYREEILMSTFDCRQKPIEREHICGSDPAASPSSPNSGMIIGWRHARKSSASSNLILNFAGTNLEKPGAAAALQFAERRATGRSCAPGGDCGMQFIMLYRKVAWPINKFSVAPLLYFFTNGKNCCASRTACGAGKKTYLPSNWKKITPWAVQYPWAPNLPAGHGLKNGDKSLMNPSLPLEVVPAACNRKCSSHAMDDDGHEQEHWFS